MTQEAPLQDARRSAGWLDRHPAVVSVLAAAGFFGLFQGIFMAWRNQDFGGPEMALAMVRIGLVVGLVTVVVLFPAFLLLRRRHPAWRRGDRLRATSSVCFGLTAAIAAWMVADRWAAGPAVPAALEPWVEIAVALAAGFAATWVQPPPKLLRAAAVATPALVVLALLPIGPAPGGPGGGGAPPDEVEPAAVTAPADAPDVVLVSIDTLRADRLGVYGRAPSLTPEMDRIAGEGVVFSRALASSPWTVPSVASMLTGLPSVRHGAGMALGSGLTFLRSPLAGEHVTLAERFAAAGYRTAAVVANGFTSPQMGLAQGFQEFDNPFTRASGSIVMRDMPLVRLVLALIPVERWGDYRAQGVTDAALEWLARMDGEGGGDHDHEKPFFLWLHYIDPHTPFQADPAALDLDAWMAEMRQLQPEARDDGTVVGEVFAGSSHVRGGMLWLGPEDRRRIEDYYDRAVAYVDEHVGRLFAALRERRAERPVIAALTSDHGEEFWDHGHFEHGHDYYREVTWIPLVFWGPGTVPAGRTVDGLAGLVDVGPTLLALAGLDPPVPEAPDEGRSLAALWRGEGGVGEGEPEPVARFAGGNLYDLPAVLMEDGAWRFILRANGMAELYDVRRDPAERFNLTHAHPELMERYRQVLEPRLAAFIAGDQGAGPAELSPETLKALKSLGYVQ